MLKINFADPINKGTPVEIIVTGPIKISNDVLEDGRGWIAKKFPQGWAFKMSDSTWYENAEEELLYFKTISVEAFR